jgi:hypothetical protein
MAASLTTRPRPPVRWLAALLALARVKADCGACFVEPVRGGATAAALIVGDAITASFYPEVDALLDDTPPDAAACTAAEGGAGVVTTRRGSLTATTLLQPCANDVLTCVDTALSTFPNASSLIKVVHFNWGWEQFEDYSINLAAYEAEIGNLYAKLQTAFPSAVFVWATTTPIKGDASITTMNDRALAALPSDVKVHDLHASILDYCEKEGSETCSLHEPAGPLTPSGRRYAAVAVSSFIAKLIPGVSTEGLRHSTQEGDATRFRPWETAMMIQGLCVMSIGILVSCAFAYLWYFERSDAVTNSWRRDDDEAMPPPVEIASVQMSALGTMASTPPATPPRARPLHRRTPSPAAPMRTPVSTDVL